jgi:peptidoglycan hydrolase-like protein with peptidoglycan-binding domain
VSTRGLLVCRVGGVRGGAPHRRQHAAVAKATGVGDESVGAGRPPQDHGALVRLLQQQLRRVGCLKAEADGAWGEKSRAALRDFARYAKLSIDDDEPTISLFDAATAAKSRVCPLNALMTR